MLRYYPVLAAEPEGRPSAVAHFKFNLGAGAATDVYARRRINERDRVAAASQLRRWVYGGG